MRWIISMIDGIRSRFTSRSTRRAKAALEAATHSEREIDRIAQESLAGSERVRRALLKLEAALERK